MSIYEKVQEACRENDISVMSLENELNFPRGSIYKWDNNRPSIDKVVKVADRLGKPIDFFVRDEVTA